MRKIISALLLAAAAQAAPAAAKAVEEPASTQAYAHAIIQAGTLRTQSQRLAKLHVQIRLGVNADAARRQLAGGIVELDRTLDELAAAATNAKIAKSLARSRELWAELRTALRGAPGSEATARIAYLSEDLMIASGKLAFQIEGELESPAGRLIDLSIRQNMLAQRLARLYMTAQLGAPTHSLRVDMEQARVEFATTIEELATARENTRSIREDLELARTQWIFFENALGRMGQRDLAAHVATSSERIMQMMDGVARQYAAFPRSMGNVAFSAAPRTN